jgi:hypothetical protein
MIEMLERANLGGARKVSEIEEVLARSIWLSHP